MMRLGGTVDASWSRICALLSRGLERYRLVVMSSFAPIVSPCVRVCAVDGARGMCVGCGRTLKEIVQWTAFTPAERETIMASLPERLNPAPSPPFESR